MKFETVLEEANDYLRSVMERSKEEFKLGSYERFDFDQEKGVFFWSEGGEPKVYAKPQFVGSISTSSNTWLWSWANDSILPGVKSQLESVRSFGEKNAYKKLTEAKWEAEEVDGWEMTAITAKLLNAQSAYRAPSGNGYAFIVFMELYWAN